MKYAYFVLVPGFLLSAAVHATTFCAHNEAEFRSALATAANNGQDDTIDLVRGTFHANGTPFDYEPAGSHGLVVRGGFNSDCSSRILNPALTVLDGDNLSQVFLGNSRLGSIAIRYVTVQNGMTTTQRGGGLSFEEYQNQPGNGDVTVSLNIIRNNYAMYGGGLDAGVGGTGILRVKNNLFVDNVASEGEGAAEIVASDDTRIYVTGNTVVGNSVTGIGRTGGIYVGRISDTPAVVSDNILWGNSGYDLESGSSILLDNDYGSSFNTPPAGSGGNVSVDPQFASATDFHLRATSPLINHGDDAPPDGVADTDLDGHVRNWMGVDIGAYERGDKIFADGFE